MKRILCTLLCVLFLVCMSGCNQINGTYAILPMKQTDSAVDEQIIDHFLTNNDDYSNYEAIQRNVPDILSYLVNVTPDDLKEKCSVYRFRYETDTSLGGETFLVYDNAVYPLGRALGGYGITEFAYTSNNGNDVLYFIYSWGSGMHRSHIGAFNFNTKEITDYGGLTFQHQDIAFHLSEDSNTLGICQAQILWSNGHDFEVTIDKGECLYEDIKILDFVAIDAEG